MAGQSHLPRCCAMPSPADSSVLPTTFMRPSALVVPEGAWPSLLDCLCQQFPAISRERWLDRFARGLVQADDGGALMPDSGCQRGMRVLYFRELEHEPEIPFYERILYQDDHLLVADKPPFLPVTPGGNYVTQTLQSRLMQQLGNRDLQPLHRIDRHTAGLVLFSVNPDTRGRYQGMFRERTMFKVYQCVAPALPEMTFPYECRSRIVRGDRFFLSQQVEGEVNAISRIDVLERGDRFWRYRLEPVTGKKHQLRLHMAALGAPIRYDALYPHVDDALAEDYQRPLQLLAAELGFTDPLTGVERYFASQQALSLL